MTEHSRAWQLGREAAKSASSRKPPKSASEKWKAEYWTGWKAGEAERKAYLEDLHKQYPQLERKQEDI